MEEMPTGLPPVPLLVLRGEETRGRAVWVCGGGGGGQREGTAKCTRVSEGLWQGVSQGPAEGAEVHRGGGSA